MRTCAALFLAALALCHPAQATISDILVYTTDGPASLQSFYLLLETLGGDPAGDTDGNLMRGADIDELACFRAQFQTDSPAVENAYLQNLQVVTQDLLPAGELLSNQTGFLQFLAAALTMGDYDEIAALVATATAALPVGALPVSPASEFDLSQASATSNLVQSCSYNGPICRVRRATCGFIQQGGEELYWHVGADWHSDDLDGNGMIDSWEAALFEEALCGGTRLTREVRCVFQSNWNTLQGDPGWTLQGLGDHIQAAVVTGLSMSAPFQQMVVDNLQLQSQYLVVTEEDAAKSASEPFSAQGDVDLDGIPNVVEYTNVLLLGGDAAFYGAAATNILLDGTTFALPFRALAALGGIVALIGALRAKRHAR